MVLKKLISKPKPLQTLASAPSLPQLPPTTSLPTISLSPSTNSQHLTNFIKLHLKTSFTPTDLLHFLKAKLHHHPSLTHFDFHIFTWASQIDSFRHDHSTYEWMVRTLSMTHRFTELNSLLQVMASNPCPCSDGVFSCVRAEPTFRFAINSYCRVGRLDDAYSAFEIMRKLIDGKANVALYNMLIHGYTKCGRYEKALAVYDRMVKDRVKPDVYTFNILISCYCRNSQFEVALDVFKEMRESGCSPNVITFNTLIKGFFRERKFDEGVHLAYEMTEMGCEVSVATCEILIDELCRVGRVSEACDLLIDFSTKGSLPDGFDCSHLIEVLCERNDVSRALQVMHELWKQAAPSLIACTTLVEGLRRSKRVEQAFGFMERMIKEGIIPDTVTFNCLLQDCCKLGRTVEADGLRLLAFSKGLSADDMTYEILVSGYTVEGRRKEGEILVDEMLDKGFIPDLATYNKLKDNLSKRRGPCSY